MKLIKDIQPRKIISAYVRAPFNKAKEELNRQHYHVISLEEMARLILQEGKNTPVSPSGCFTKEAFLYIPKRGKFLTKKSPIIQHPNDATAFHQKEERYYLMKVQVEKSLSNSFKLPNKDFSVPTNRFGEDDFSNYIFGTVTREYGFFLNEAGIKKMPISLDDIDSTPFASQVYFCGLNGKFGLDGSGENLCGNLVVRGVLN